MTVARTLAYWYLPVQVDHDPTGDPFVVSVDGGATFPGTATWFTSATVPPAVLAKVPAASPGLTWYFGRILAGASGVTLQQGSNTVIGKITDTPQIPWLSWTIYIQHTQ